MAVVLLLVSLVCFGVKSFDGHIGSFDLDGLGHVFLVASFLVGPVVSFAKRGGSK